VIEDGGNATTPLTAVWDTMDDSGAVTATLNAKRNSGETAKVIVTGDVGLTNDQRQVTFFEPSKSTSAADNLARARFYKKLYSQSTKFQGLTFVGELRETLHMLRRPASALYSKAHGYLDALSKAKRASPKAWTKQISGLWLEQSFGWKPLINDVKDAVSAYEALVIPKPKPAYVTGSGKWEFDRTSELDSFHRDGTVIAVHLLSRWRQSQCRLREKHIVRYRGAVRAQVEAPHWSNWELFGFTPENLVPTAWELLPWSFLVDYFTNIGDILQASITSTRNLTYINKTIIRETQYNGRVDLVENSLVGFDSNWKITSEGSQFQDWELKRKRVDRSPNVGISLPTLQLSASLSDGQLFNVAALLGQARALHPQRYR
jgi:hypothetical protein